MQKNPILDFRVGVFVLIGIIILTVLLLFIGDFRIFKSGYNINLIFRSANGLKKNAPVDLAGVEVGQVKRISIFFDSKDNKIKVDIKVWLEAGTKIPPDSIAEIKTLGILGEKYVDITPGKDCSRFLQEADSLIGEDTASLDDVTNLAKKIALKLDKSINEIDEVVGDSKVRNDLKQTIGDLKLLVEQIQSGTGTIGKLIYDEKIYNDLEEFVADIKAHPWKLFFRKK